MPPQESSPDAQSAGITCRVPAASARVRPSKLAGGSTTTRFARFCLLSYKVRALGNELLIRRAPQRRDWPTVASPMAPPYPLDLL
jgi:hypothetical protein